MSKAIVHAPALAISLAWVALVGWISIAEHVTFNTTSRDIGVYVQVLWGTAHGRPFHTTLLETNRVHLAEHVAPLLPALAPLYGLRPDPTWLFVAQHLTLALAGIPVYLLARRRLAGAWLPTLCAAAYFAMPTLDEIAFDAFYPVSFTALPLAWAAYLLIVGRWRAGVACALIAPLIEEEAALVVVGLGAYLLVRREARRWAAPLLAVGLLWLVLVALAVMPPFHEPSTLPTSADNRTLGHFEQLRRRPGEALAVLATERIPPAARWLFAPTGGVALVAPEVLLIDLPHVVTLLTADKEGRFRRHWAAPMVPIIWLATVVGLARLRRPPLRALGVSLLAVGVVTTYLADSSLPGGDDYEPDDVVWTERSEQLDLLVSRLPAGRPVAASRRVLGHVANRFELYVFPPSYSGALWPPEGRIEAQLLDLTNDQTREALAGRSSPLRARRPYAVWLAGPDAMLLTDHPPPPAVPIGRDLGTIRLLGYDATAKALTLHWQAVTRPTASLNRVVMVLDADGRVIAEQRGTPLDDFLATDQWPSGQIVLDRVRFGADGRPVERVVVGWARPDGSGERTELAIRP